MKGLIVSVLSVLCLAGTVTAQVDAGPLHTRPETGIIDGVYIQTNIPTKRLIPYEYVREADVIWSKRVWRTIDLREKMNHPLYFPMDEFDSEGNWIRNASRWSLWTIIRTGILAGNLTVYSPYNPLLYTMRDGDQFKYPILPADGKNYRTDAKYREEINLYLATLGEESDVPFTGADGWDSVDAQGNLVYPDRDTNYYMSKDIVQYRLKEDYFFDKERSILDVRIIGIAPVIFEKDNNGFITGKKELFWLYFPECRYVFNNYFVYNEHNDARWMSFDDLFWKRRFASTIDKRSNVYDRDIEKYRVGVDALLESQKITEEIRNIEHDVWSF
ncbi:protein involved in gliding motility GldN [Lishizhenia tianjinensis]|uniref:Protein involved in gliding motility GldN n=1 Tax=Lishizhenia tianjinensis TaxID=477690 RepID=A0A1I7BSF0_9FLAO|nr:gliding motility protein GldN [Lishizhenia tianjinensis]SFT90100.1 protein involved in gliding motility GldN [Lishizhenia tianjinensis]